MTEQEFQAAVICRFDAIDQEFQSLATDINALFTEAQRQEDAAHAAIGERLDRIDQRLANGSVSL